MENGMVIWIEKERRHIASRVDLTKDASTSLEVCFWYIRFWAVAQPKMLEFRSDLPHGVVRNTCRDLVSMSQRCFRVLAVELRAIIVGLLLTAWQLQTRTDSDNCKCIAQFQQHVALPQVGPNLSVAIPFDFLCRSLEFKALPKCCNAEELKSQQWFGKNKEITSSLEHQVFLSLKLLRLFQPSLKQMSGMALAISEDSNVVITDGFQRVSALLDSEGIKVEVFMPTKCLMLYLWMMWSSNLQQCQKCTISAVLYFTWMLE